MPPQVSGMCARFTTIPATSSRNRQRLRGRRALLAYIRRHELLVQAGAGLAVTAHVVASGDVGTTLRCARQARGLSFDDVAAATGVGAGELAALEGDRLGDGRRARAMAHLRVYARVLELDAEELLARFERAHPLPHDPPAAWSLPHAAHLAARHAPPIRQAPRSALHSLFYAVLLVVLVATVVAVITVAVATRTQS